MKTNYIISESVPVTVNTANDIIIGSQSVEGLAAQTVRQGVELIIPRTQQVDKPYNFQPMDVPFTLTDETLTGVKEIIFSDINTPVYSNVTFGHSKEGSDIKYTGIDGKEYTLPRLTFNAILISVSFPRNIVKTAIQGRDGTVKEYIGESDATISFRGVITGLNGQYPAEEIKQLKQLITAPISVPVISEYLNNLGIYNVVFEDRSLEQEEGGYSYQGFSLNAVSDQYIDLYIS